MPGPTFPFDHRPDSGFSVSTGNFTVPADVYVQASCVSSTTALVVDGTTILLGMDAPDVDAEGSWNINSGETSLHTNTTGQSKEITVMIQNTTGTRIITVDNGAGDYTFFDTGAATLLTSPSSLPSPATTAAHHARRDRGASQRPEHAEPLVTPHGVTRAPVPNQRLDHVPTPDAPT